MLHSKKVSMFFALVFVSLQTQADWEQEHKERKAIHRKMDKKERKEKQKIDRENASWETKHKERKAVHAKIKAEESREKAALEDNKHTWRKRKAEHTQKHAEREARRVKTSKGTSKK